MFVNNEMSQEKIYATFFLFFFQYLQFHYYDDVCMGGLKLINFRF